MLVLHVSCNSVSYVETHQVVQTAARCQGCINIALSVDRVEL